MKRLLLSSLCLILCVSLSAQRSRISAVNNGVPTVEKHMRQVEQTVFHPNLNATKRLTARVSSDFYEALRFSYGWHGLINAIKDSSGTNLLYIDSVYYNDNSQVTKISCYQYFFNTQTWKNVNYVNFFYDEEGHLVKRTNFNIADEETFTQGGVYDYHYENGRLVRHDMYFGDYDLFYEKCYYTYDVQGRLYQEKYLQGFYSFDSTLAITYAYDDDGKMIHKSYDYYGNGNPNSEDFVYDAYGNCIDHSDRDSYGNYTDRNMFEYDTEVPASTVHMPYYVEELEIPEAFDDAHQRVLEHWYTLDEDHILRYICDYYYYYEDSPLAVENEVVESMVNIYPNPAIDVVKIEVPEGKMIVRAQVYDICGRICDNFSLQGSSTLNVSNLPVGMYLLRLDFENGERSVAKIVKKSVH